MKRGAVELRTTRTFESISMSPCQLERTRALVLGGGIIQSGQIQIQIHSANICGWLVLGILITISGASQKSTKYKQFKLKSPNWCSFRERIVRICPES